MFGRAKLAPSSPPSAVRSLLPSSPLFSSPSTLLCAFGFCHFLCFQYLPHSCVTSVSCYPLCFLHLLHSWPLFVLFFFAIPLQNLKMRGMRANCVSYQWVTDYSGCGIGLRWRRNNSHWRTSPPPKQGEQSHHGEHGKNGQHGINGMAIAQ